MGRGTLQRADRSHPLQRFRPALKITLSGPKVGIPEISQPSSRTIFRRRLSTNLTQQFSQHPPSRRDHFGSLGENRAPSPHYKCSRQDYKLHASDTGV